MRWRTSSATLGVLASLGQAMLLVIAGAGAASAADVPRPVSPGAPTTSEVAEARCPTFSWAGVAGASGYEVAVFRLSSPSNEEPVLVTQAAVAGDARAWTPPLPKCLARGERYAWSVAATYSGTGAESELDWAPAMLFEVEAPPSMDELERALATIERHLESRAADRGPRAAADAVAGDPRSVDGRNPRGILPGALTAPTLAPGITRTTAADAAPVIGTASLTVSNQIHLAAASHFFKNNALFLWDDDDGNLALGRTALDAITVDAIDNTAVGGYALSANTTGDKNTAFGGFAIGSNTTGEKNTSVGNRSLAFLNPGSRNTALGYKAGFGTAGDDNILINHYGASESNVLRIGSGNGTDDFDLDKAFIYGILGESISSSAPVLTNATGQLGTVAASSITLKQDVEDLGPLADRLLELRPVSFRYRDAVAADPATPSEFGLIAEEVAQVWPALVDYDEDGKPQGVKYHLLSALLLGEVQRLHARLEAVESRRQDATGSGHRGKRRGR